MQNILITGANRGIGLALVEQYLAQGATVRIYATCRNPDGAGVLSALAETNPERLQILQLDVDDEASISARGETSHRGRKRAAWTSSSTTPASPGATAARNMGQLASAEVAAVLTTNAVAPLIVTQACRELLQNGEQSARGHDIVRHGITERCRRQRLRLSHEQSGHEHGGARAGLG